MKYPSVVIVVPMYRVEMDALESVSWQQLIRVLGKYPICIVAPILIAATLRKTYGVRVEAFPEDCFRSVQTYSRLLLDITFYRRFQAYEYMLVYQLDAFVFSDRLAEFCSMGYDYIGAPWPYWLISHRFFKRARVGNGGFSLRKISAACDVLQKKEAILDSLSDAQKKYCLDAEDVFWGYCAWIPSLHFSVPKPLVARTFSIESLTRIPIASDHLPFGCHGWSTYGFWGWRSVITSFGYGLPECHDLGLQATRLSSARQYLHERLLKSPWRYPVLRDVLRCIPHAKRIVLWGWGTYGKTFYDLLRMGQCHIAAIYDRKQCGITTEEGIVIEAPQLHRIQEEKPYILVSTVKFEDEICGELDSMGWKEGRDYGRISVFRDRIYRTYLQRLITGTLEK